jgi:oxygen-independent coproporphyrinogen-3 oxidase
VFDSIRRNFALDGPICVETTPLDLDRDVARALRSLGVDLLSVGVQSFEDRSLKLIGRPYRGGRAREALEAAVEAGFQSVNCDLMFALPGQSVEALIGDIDTAAALGASQITTYPLFTFPYSTIGAYLRLRKVRMPPLGTRRKAYHALSRHLTASGFERASVWGFTRGGAPRYSSVTRDDYYGLGAGAGTHAGEWYSLNTFSVPEYVERCLRGESPVALAVPFSEAMTRYHWLYWRLYETRVDLEEFEERFAGDRRARALLALVLRLGFAEKDCGQLRLNQRGAFWVHLAQNLFSLRYINDIWSVAKGEAWPRAIPF